MPQYYKGEQIYFAPEGPVTLAATYVPNLPKTGFEPQNGFTLALSLVLLVTVAIVAYPYVRKAIIAIGS
jgi:hypothetical protein